MKKIRFMPVTLLLILALSFFMACDEDEKEEVHPLVGTWTMDNMSQTSVFVAAVDLAALGFAEGDTIASGGLTWAEFSALGVNASVIVNDDNTFTLNGNLPTANDTLGVAPSIIPLTDEGTWEAAEDLSTFLLDGALYDLGGLLTVDDENDPTDMGLAYSEIDTSLAKVLPVAGVGYFDILVDEHSSTVLGFVREE